MRFTVFTLTLLAAATTNAFAAEAEPTAWLRVQTDVPYDGKAPLYFNFQPDEAVCKKQYGDAPAAARSARVFEATASS